MERILVEQTPEQHVVVDPESGAEMSYSRPGGDSVPELAPGTYVRMEDVEIGHNCWALFPVKVREPDAVSRTVARRWKLQQAPMAEPFRMLPPDAAEARARLRAQEIEREIAKLPLGLHCSRVRALIGELVDARHELHYLRERVPGGRRQGEDPPASEHGMPGDWPV